MALDDFGTGYSSLSLPAQLPDRPRQDRPLLRLTGRRRTKNAAAIVTAITPWPTASASGWWPRAWRPRPSWSSCSELGCDEAQGYLFARPCRPRSTRPCSRLAGWPSCRPGGSKLGPSRRPGHRPGPRPRRQLCAQPTPPLNRSRTRGPEDLRPYELEHLPLGPRPKRLRDGTRASAAAARRRGALAGAPRCSANSTGTYKRARLAPLLVSGVPSGIAVRPDGFAVGAPLPPGLAKLSI